MPITNKPAITNYQVGEIVYYYKAIGQPAKAKIVKTKSVVTDNDNNSTAEQVDIYLLEGEGLRQFKMGQIFQDASLISEDFGDKLVLVG